MLLKVIKSHYGIIDGFIISSRENISKDNFNLLNTPIPHYTFTTAKKNGQCFYFDTSEIITLWLEYHIGTEYSIKPGFFIIKPSFFISEYDI